MNAQDKSRRRPKVTLTLARETLEWVDARCDRRVSRGAVVDGLVERVRADDATKAGGVAR